MVYKVVIIVDGVSSDVLNTLYNALKPEESIKVKGINVTVNKSYDETKLIIVLEAPTISSIRAVLNSTLRLSKLVIDSIENI
ncbi:MAG: KEOPS complex subunit Pcc1 [Sulfolobales archaeon]|jgi:tRNA threonylcarbamoyladenosine modification (KEOPS) complex  Pcc1 subunit|nr:CTAG/PCC1 family protein [Desulfurococcaceae archaeon]